MNTRLFNTGLRRYCHPASLLALAMMAFATPSMAATVALGFACNSHNNSANCVTGKHPLRVTPEQCTADTASFTLRNAGARASAIGQLYFDERKGLLRSIAALSLRSHGRNPFPEHGINQGMAGDAVKFLSGSDLESLRLAIAAGELHPGLRPWLVTGGFGESLVIDGPAAVPVPETVWLFASGLFGFVSIARRRSATSAASLNASQ